MGLKPRALLRLRNPSRSNTALTTLHLNSACGTRMRSLGLGVLDRVLTTLTIGSTCRTRIHSLGVRSVGHNGRLKGLAGPLLLWNARETDIQREGSLCGFRKAWGVSEVGWEHTSVIFIPCYPSFPQRHLTPPPSNPMRYPISHPTPNLVTKRVLHGTGNNIQISALATPSRSTRS